MIFGDGKIFNPYLGNIALGLKPSLAIFNWNISKQAVSFEKQVFLEFHLIYIFLKKSSVKTIRETRDAQHSVKFFNAFCSSFEMIVN